MAFFFRRGRPGPRGRSARRTRRTSPGRGAARPRCRSRRRARSPGCSSPRRNARSWETKSMVPSKSRRASTSISLVARSRWFVGSSSTRKFGGSSSMRAITRRDFSPPERARILFSTSSPENWKAPEQAPQRAHALLGKVLLDLLPDGELGVEEVERLLGEVAELRARPQPDRARVRSEHAGHHAQQGGLARAVLAHDAPALAAPQGEAEPVVDHAAAVGLAHALEHRRPPRPSAAGRRKSKRTTCRFLGSSIFSIFSRAFTRLCTCAAFAAWAEKRSMKRCSLASLACWRA